MTIKHLSAFVALGALSLVVACSSSSGSVVPNQPGTAPEAVHTAAVVTTDAADASATLADAKANVTSPIKVKPAILAFTATGASHAKNFTVREARYKGVFRLSKSCKARISLSDVKVNGPSAKVGVTPNDSVGRCVVTITDSNKNKAIVDVSVDLVTPPSPTASPSNPPPTASASPSTAPSASPSTAPSASPSTAPSASPSTAPSGSPDVITNGNFASGDLTGWHQCSFGHTPLTTLTNPSPSPLVTTSPQTATTVAIATPFPAPTASPGNAMAIVGTVPANYNPSGAAPSVLGTYAAQVGSPVETAAGATGICQSFTPTLTDHFLSFWVWEGGSENSFKFGDQEATILDSTGTTVVSQLYSELNCFVDAGSGGAGTGIVGNAADASSVCLLTPPTPKVSIATGGSWVQRGPYDLTTQIGTPITLFLGVWQSSKGTFDNTMYVGNVQVTSSSTFPTTFSGRHHAAVQKKNPAFRGARAQIIHN
jgi:hypothetical protein